MNPNEQTPVANSNFSPPPAPSMPSVIPVISAQPTAVAPPPTSGVSIAAPVAPRVDGLPAASENIYTEIASQIIKEQEQIIGVLAIEQASHVEGLVIDPVTYHCTIIGSGSTVIDSLIDQYRDFFGHAAVEVCKEAASRFLSRLPAEQMPMSLR